MNMIDEDMEMLNGSINIMKHMLTHLRALNVEEAAKDISELDEKKRRLYARKDGKDTIFFDIVAENAISLGTDFWGHYSLFQRVYSQSGVIITEERGRVPDDRRIEHNTPVIISDPVDRSSYLEQAIEAHKGKCKTMGEVLDAERERIGEDHARVEACNSSVTLLKDNTIKYTVVLNLFTGEVFVGYEPGVFQANIGDISSVDDLTEQVRFKTDETNRMLCYNTPGKYENNRMGTHLRQFDLDPSIKSPGGPIRFTYLLEPTGKPVSDIGVIAHNGEKIQESLPNIAIAYFSGGALQAYKLFCDREFHEHRAGKVLTPNLMNSIYNQGMIVNTGIKLAFLNNHMYPSEFRDTSVIFPKENEMVFNSMEGMVQREFAQRII
ncbi:MAG: hypothetical protein KKG59_03230 [Nanoarchaeota archaeon]|nr:hypothetical protein [Nanoarchaeota archaeon]